MNKPILFPLMILALAATILFRGIGIGQAESMNGSKSQATTGPFRSEQNVMPLRRVTNAQREEAAKRLKALRDAAAGGKVDTKTKAADPNASPKKKGGTYE